MSKIIKIDGDDIFIGNSDGTITTVHRNDCSGFTPNIGDVVEVYKTETQVIVSKSSTLSQSEIVQQVEPGKRPVNKVAYCLLTFFVGGFGIHKFYVGRIGAGIMYLLFFWTCIPAFLALIELIVAICQPADVNGNIYV